MKIGFCGRCCLGFHGVNDPDEFQFLLSIPISECTCKCHELNNEERKEIRDSEGGGWD